MMVEQGDQELSKISGILTKHSINVTSISVSKPDLGDVYLLYTGKKLREEENE